MEEETIREPPADNHDNITTSDTDDNDDVDRPAECGIWKMKPAGAQMCANISAFTGTYSLSALLTSTLTTYVNSQVSLFFIFIFYF